MTERPIIFNDAMSLAVTEGRKTVTRRPIALKHQGHDFVRMQDGYPDGLRAVFTDGEHDYSVHSPFGMHGGKLWVREAWRVDFADTLIEYRADPGMNGARWLDERCDVEAARKWGAKLRGGKWAPSIHMPRWASRTVLDVLDVRVERLQSMSEEDARAEGFESRAAFCGTWDAIYPTMGMRHNPWAWVIEFRRAT